ncbi:MAG: hypothetical protein ACUVR0_07975 [Candidatus Aminicenantales bacterium]
MAGEWPQETGHRRGYDRVSLKEREERRPGRVNQGEKTSTDVDARSGEWKRRGTWPATRTPSLNKEGYPGLLGPRPPGIPRVGVGEAVALGGEG